MAKDDSTILFEEIGARMRADLISSGNTEMVCGPITTGGLGSVERNLELFNRVIATLLGLGHPIWSQMPFEEEIFAAKAVWFAEHPGESYCSPILELCYNPLFKLNRIKVAHFIPGRLPGPGHSRGTAWEFEHLSALGVLCQDIDSETIEFLM